MMQIRFYSTEAGNEPVREWLRNLEHADRKVIGDDLQTVQLGFHTGLISEPLIKGFGAGTKNSAFAWIYQENKTNAR